MKKIFYKYLPLLFLAIISFGYFWKFFLKGLIPFPGDLLVGAYYPWLESKWGFEVGVPVKNPLISDVFSQLYIWKDMLVTSIRELRVPLWNPTMYSGYPLLANFQSGFLNIFNVFPLLFGMVKGWGLMMWGQVIGSCFTMYFLLKRYKYSTVACLLGSVIYSFGGFPIVWMEYATVGQAMVWVPLVLLAIESTSFYWLPLLFLLIVGAGHFQALVYTAFIAVLYFLFRHKRDLKELLPKFVIAGLLSMGISAVQLLPTIEFSKYGIRFAENYVQNFNYGLAPIQHFFTLLAPDFFGNPVTNNYWGSFNYENVIYYAGLFSFLSLLASLFNWKNLKNEKFFVCLAVASLLLGFDTFIGKSIYIFGVPGLSTSVAGRIGMVFTLAISILAANFVSSLHVSDKKVIYKSVTVALLMFFIGAAILIVTKFMFQEYPQYLTSQINNSNVGLRNLVIPFGLLCVFSVLLLLRKHTASKWIILFITTVELFRFGWKYTTFSPQYMIYPKTEITNFLETDRSVFRADKEKAELLPPNTWAAYGLQSPSGYDPMAILDYIKTYDTDLNGENNPGISRYSELRRYDAGALGKYNVKYLLAIKRNKNGEIPGDNLNYKIDEKEWKRVFETEAVAVLLNEKYKERARIVDSEGNEAKGTAKIVSYENNKVVIDFTNIDGEKLLLADTYYPGWKATVNGKTTKIGDTVKPFRTIDIRGIKSGTVVFEYKPDSFRFGLIISGISVVAWLLWIFIDRRKAS